MVAVEEPLEIRLAEAGSETSEPVAITMRTPGHDRELSAGFLFGEGLINGRPDIHSIESTGPLSPGTGLRNTVVMTLSEGVSVDPGRLKRHFYGTSSCGVCGKRSLEALSFQQRFDPRDSGFHMTGDALQDLPERLRRRQSVFEQTGALHAAASVDPDGRLWNVFEDVGRHNALDKLIGASLLADQLPFSERGIVLSGRASFELLQKAVMAGCPLVAAIGGPSSLAVQVAREYGISLVGFVRQGRFNLYAGSERVTG